MPPLTLTPDPADPWPDFTLIDLAFDPEFDPAAELDARPRSLRPWEDA